MDIFKSEKLPYILGLLVTVMGWCVNQFVSEVTRTQAVSYSLDVDRTTGEIKARIRNVSRTKSLVNVTFSLACAHGAECLAPLYPVEQDETPVYGEVRAIPPNAISSELRRGSRRSVALSNTVAAGGRYEIIGRLANPNAEVDFYYVPGDRPLDIFIYRRRTLTGLLIENYTRVLILLFAFCALAFVVSIVRLGSGAADSGPTEKKNGAEPPDRGAAGATKHRRRGAQRGYQPGR